MKPTFQQIAHHYLGESLNATYTDTFGETAVGTLDGVDTRYQRVHIDGCVTYDCKPHFRPLSSLTQEIEVNGERFVPLTKLIAMYRELAEKYPPYMEFTDMLTSLNTGIHEMPFWIVQQLLAWHFNCFSLSEDQFIAITH